MPPIAPGYAPSPPAGRAQATAAPGAGDTGCRMVPGRVDNAELNVLTAPGTCVSGRQTAIGDDSSAPGDAGGGLVGPALDWNEPGDRARIGTYHPQRWQGQTQFHPLAPAGFELAVSSIVEGTSTLEGCCLGGAFARQLVEEPASRGRCWGYYVPKPGFFLTLEDTAHLQERLVAEHGRAWIAADRSCKALFKAASTEADPALARFFGFAVAHHLAAHPINDANEVTRFCAYHGIDRTHHRQLPELAGLWRSLARAEGLRRLREGATCPQIAAELGLQIPAFEEALRDVAVAGPLIALVRGGAPVIPLCDVHAIAIDSLAYRDLAAMRLAFESTPTGRTTLNEFDVYRDLDGMAMAREFWEAAVSADSRETLDRVLTDFTPVGGRLYDELADLFREYRDTLVAEYPALGRLQAGQRCPDVAAASGLLPESREMDVLRLYAVHLCLQKTGGGSVDAAAALDGVVTTHQLPPQSAAWQVMSTQAPVEAFRAVRAGELDPEAAQKAYGIAASGVAADRLRELSKLAEQGSSERRSSD